jgi:outer membrane protein TolC
MFIKPIAAVHLMLVILFSFITSPAIFAASELRLQDLISELVKSNPELVAAEARYQAALLKPSIVRSYPDPRITFGWMSAGTILPGGSIGEDPNANISIQVAQMFPYAGKRDLRSGIADKEAENLKWMRASDLNSRIAALKSAYYELASVHDILDLFDENKDLLLQLQKAAEARYSIGKTMQQDLIRTGTELAILENRKLTWMQRKASLAAEINLLLNRDSTIELGRPEKIEVVTIPDFESLRSIALKNSPSLKAQQATVNGRQLQVQLTKKELYPDLDLMSGYYYMGELEDMWEVKAEVSLPIFSRSKQKKETARAELEKIEAQEVYKASERSLEFRLREAYLKAETARNLLDLYSNRIVPQSYLALESSLASYEAGTIDFFAVLANFTTILQYRMNLYEQRSEYFKAVAALEELTAGQVPAGIETLPKKEVQQ